MNHAIRPKPDEFLDCVGLFCPEPLFQTREKLDALEIGQILEVIADYPAGEEDLKRLCKRTGQDFMAFEQTSRWCSALFN